MAMAMETEMVMVTEVLEVGLDYQRDYQQQDQNGDGIFVSQT
jgi:hypothetical protein